MEQASSNPNNPQQFIEGSFSSNIMKLNYSNLRNQACRVIGSEGQEPGQFDFPRDIVVDSSTNHLIVSEWHNNRVQVLGDDGSFIRFIGNGRGNELNQIGFPWGLALSDGGRLFVCDNGNKRIQSWQLSDGSYLGLFQVDFKPHCVAIGPSGDQLFVSLYSNKIQVIGMDGQPIRSIGMGQGSLHGQLNYPVGLAFNSHGDLLVGDSWNKRISVFEASSGEFVTNFGQFSGGNLNLSIDSFDRVIVSDSGSHRLEFFDGGFQSIGQFGSWGNEIGQFFYPNGVRIDEQNGRLIVCDYGNHRLQIINGAATLVC